MIQHEFKYNVEIQKMLNYRTLYWNLDISSLTGTNLLCKKSVVFTRKTTLGNIKNYLKKITL